MSQLAHKPRIFRNLRRLVLKVGSGVLAGEDGLRREVIARIALEVSKQAEAGRQAIVVTSGAVAAGRLRLHQQSRSSIGARQAAAAVGQIELMRTYAEEFARFGLTAAQLLLTHQDLAEKLRRENARHTLNTLLRQGAVPIINENDTVAVEEIRFGDNDHLSALVAVLAQAGLLVMLSDVPGVLTGDPRRRRDVRRIPLIADGLGEIRGVVADGAGPLGSGGMASKLKAAREVTRAGAAVIIASGIEADGLAAALDPNRESGTLILPSSAARLKGRKHWIAYALKPAGWLRLDRGAVLALRVNGKSLLPSGIQEVRGDFASGDCVALADQDGQEFGRGLVNYPAAHVLRVKGRRSDEIMRLLGYKVSDEIIHRDNMVVLKGS
jgi:glutamate 5-kinase